MEETSRIINPSGRAGFTAKAPGKLILTGEHAVVYGRMALATSLDLYTSIQVTFIPEPNLKIILEDLNQYSITIPLADLPGIPSDLEESIRLSLTAIIHVYSGLIRPEARNEGVQFIVKSAIPIGAGLGSSSAFSVAISAACFRLTKNPSDPSEFSSKELELINGWAFKCEQMFHSTPSGIDNSVSTFGGVIKFEKKEVVGTLPPLSDVRILLVDTGISRQTRRMVDGVRAMRERFPDIVEPILDSIHQISLKMAELIQLPASDNYPAIQELLSTNHHLLAALGVTHGALDGIHDLARAHDQAGKMTGAGGGGLAFIWLDPAASEMKIGALKCELPSLMGTITWRSAQLGVQGVKIELV